MVTSDPKDDNKTTVSVQNVTDNNWIADGDQIAEIDEAYLRSSWFPKLYKSVLFQMIMFGA